MTTLVDDFNRADAGSLGTTSDGLATWVAYSGTFGISSNTAVCTVSGSPSIACVETHAADGTVQVTILDNPGTPHFTAVVVRATDGDNYIAFFSGFIEKYIAGSQTDIQNPGPTFSAGDVVAVVMSGSSLEMFVNGVSVATVTETYNQTATQHGLRGASGSNWDSFSAPFASVAAARPLPSYATRRQAVMRAATR